MTIFQLRADVRTHQYLVTETDSFWRSSLSVFDGTPLEDRWTPLSVSVLVEDESGSYSELLPPGDFTELNLSGIPVFSDKAVKVLDELIQPYGELLMLSGAGKRYSVFNVTAFVDALDESKSDLVRFASGKIMTVNRYAFRRDVSVDIPIFKLPQLPRGPVFVSADFVDRVRTSGLSGFDFLEPKESASYQS